ncbi:hypothetical protein FKP32DRAFT_1605095 [Trametes sanguinea]|nr:hypothetical protein FKP32DRAFT_1605095 [Trametes sanguinea]
MLIVLSSSCSSLQSEDHRSATTVSCKTVLELLITINMSLQPVLPEDVLLAVLAAADRADAARMMRASRFFYAHGPRAVLRQVVTISSDKELSQFLAFLSAGGTRRSQFVQSLEVDFPKSAPSTIGSGSNLMSFELPGDPDPDDHTKRNIVERFRRLGIALKGMCHLKSLSVSVHWVDELVEFIALLSASAIGKTSGKGLYGILHSLTLDISVARLDLEGVNELAALLRMSNLQRLSIPHDGRMFLYGPTNLTEAFATLPAIQSPKMRSCIFGDSDNLRKLKTLRFKQLVSVQLSFLPSMRHLETNPDPAPSDLHPIDILSHFRNTLEELRTYGWYTHPDVAPDSSIVYPKMRRLRMDSTGIPLAMVYIDGYPNLASLEYSTVVVKDCGKFDSRSIQFYDERRHFNIAAQTLSNRTWTHLEECRGNLIDLYMLGLTCPIDRLYLRLGCRQIFDALRGQGGSRLESLHIDLQSKDMA